MRGATVVGELDGPPDVDAGQVPPVDVVPHGDVGEPFLAPPPRRPRRRRRALPAAATSEGSPVIAGHTMSLPPRRARLLPHRGKPSIGSTPSVTRCGCRRRRTGSTGSYSPRCGATPIPRRSALRRTRVPPLHRRLGRPLDIDDQVGGSTPCATRSPTSPFRSTTWSPRTTGWRSGARCGEPTAANPRHAPTGREVVTIVDIARIEDGRIVEHWGGPDLFDLDRQLTTPTGWPTTPPRDPGRRRRSPIGKSQKAVSGRS